MLSGTLQRYITAALSALIVLPFVFLCACVPAAKTSAKSDERAEDICLRFLEDNGWQARYLPDETKDVVLKNTPSMKPYYSLQNSQGFQTQKYIGREVRVYSFLIQNASFPEANGTVLSHCYFCDGEIIAADVCSTASDGWMIGVIKKRGEPDETR